MSRRLLLAGLALITCGLVVMWLGSYSTYTSVGIDFEQAQGARVLCTFYRLRWPGDGSFRVGIFIATRPTAERPVEPFDLGGRFFQPARKSVPQSLWNRLGFWWIDEAKEPPTGESWVGIPSWLPPLLSGASMIRIRRRQQPSARMGVE